MRAVRAQPKSHPKNLEPQTGIQLPIHRSPQTPPLPEIDFSDVLPVVDKAVAVAPRPHFAGLELGRSFRAKRLGLEAF